MKTTQQMNDWLRVPVLKKLYVFGLILGLAAALGAARPALAQQAVTAQLNAQGGSGVSGTATVTAAGAEAHAPNADDATRVSLEVRGLPPGASAQTALHAGTCATPSASFSSLPSLTADSSGRGTATGFVLFRSNENVAFSTVADGDHIISISSGGRVVACGAIPAGTAGSLNESLLAEGEKHQVIQFNPNAALQKRILADRFVPNSPEFSVTLEGVAFAVQRAERLDTGTVRVYFARVGDWGNVVFAQRGEPGAPFAFAMLEAGEKQQVIQFNPGAALQRRIFADGFVLNSAEMRLTIEGGAWAAQRAENLGSGQVRVYYAPVGDWSGVRFVERRPQ